MQCSNVTTIPKGLLQLQGSLSSMMDSLYYDPKVAELMNTSMGQYLNGHPFLALAVLVFGAMATVPIGIFLTFATVTFIAVTVGFILLEVLLLSLGGISLLCVLSALAILAILVSLVFVSVRTKSLGCSLRQIKQSWDKIEKKMKNPMGSSRFKEL
ncbi:lipid droplet assembly factor 1 isoform X4 [Salmo salar]|nr:lipid droplet assembly factor 1-like isoform X4 [Salmo salar]XP_014049556.1 lipid droplet assembly factor 1-like isoform X4 [Salmo salar]XP_045571453.1 lipid droplet assembly factor 1-like isoform X4 [Salmo salar]|eukprot:XP_014049555.1 PREDICTED: promethin-like isoform X3 [Salmo salar]